MQPEHLNFDSYEMFKESDGYINITMLDEQVMRTLLEKSMDLTGHSLYATNRTNGDGKVTLTFVTHARAAELKEQHLHSCRNSLGGIIPEPLREVQASIRSLGLERDVSALNPDCVLEQGYRTVTDPQQRAHEMYYRTITVPHEPKDKPE
ncbi:hypothetical protein FDI21_gp081 [Pseudomonas phage Noxifer]|uniref:Uncharacterized protein n=1 Tax=Pseudomonas phage Noxifer TaxID=2006684 RepID=A0A1Y0SUS0_9CAUD|nr:hypothetical protein FDI21_gp081 [Pseudomonas phage Noxifer]ARV77252.1 hypothetical protein NOXIFER_81 [Pseudomonas phage Noxifer]